MESQPPAETTPRTQRRSSPLRVGLIVVGAMLAVFIITNLIVSRTPYWFLQPWIGPLARQNMKLTCVLRDRTPAQVILIGDSRVRHDCVANLLMIELGANHEVLNLALDASQLIASHEIVKRVLDRLPPPEVVVLGISEVQMNGHGPRLERDLRLYASPAMMARGLWLCPDFDQKLGALEGLTRGLEVIYQLPARSELDRTCELTRAGRGSAYLYPLTEITRAYNHKAVPYHDPDARERAFQRKVDEYHENLRDFSMGFTRDLLGETIDRLQAAGVRVIIMIPPESARFVSATPGPAREEVHAWLEKLCLDKKLILADLTGPDYNPPAESFFDYATHLEPEAAIELTRRFTRDFVAPALVEQPK